MSSSAARHATRIFVANLPWTVGTTELRQFGSSFGRVTHASVVFDRNTGLSKGYGFLVYANGEGGGEGLIKPGNSTHFLEGNHITCTLAHNTN